MKKTLSFILAAVVVLSALVVLASCGGSGTIDGEWKAEIELGKFMGGGEDDLGVDLSGKSIDVLLNLKADGTFTVGIDEEKYKSVMKDVYKASFEAVAEAYGFSVDDYIAMIGASNLDEAVEMMLTDDEDADVEGSEGNYKYENDVLDLGETAFKVELSGSKLIFKELVSGEESGVIGSSLLPLTFTRK